MSEKRLKIEIKDIPYVSIENYILTGSLEDVAKNILGLRDKLKESYDYRESKEGVKYYSTPLIPFEDYKYIELDYEYNYNADFGLRIRCYRDETDEEYNKRIELAKKRSEAAKLAAKNRKEAQQKRELSLLKTLKEKYENNG
jgi:hypothetical protein